MTKYSIKNSKGSTLVLNLLVMAVFSIMAVMVYKAAKSMVGEAVYYQRSAQALTIAEAGLEDALHSLYSTATWRTGFTQKPFAGGYYTVSVTTPSALSVLVTSSGYSSPLLLTGRAVKAVSAIVVFVSTDNVANSVRASNLTVEGTVDAYDPRVSLTPASFTDGGTLWADAVDTNGACGSARIFSNVVVYNAAAPAVPLPPLSPGAGCVNSPTDTVTSTNTHVVLPLHICNAACQSQALLNNANLNVINPLTTPYNVPSQSLTVAAGKTVALSSGTYYFKDVSVKGILNVDTVAGPVAIYFTNKFTSDGSCAINNLSLLPSKLMIADVAGTVGSHTFTIQCPVALHAYMETSVNHLTVKSGQEVFGHFSGETTIIAAGAKAHFDLSEGFTTAHVAWATGPLGSWTESYKRQ